MERLAWPPSLHYRRETSLTIPTEMVAQMLDLEHRAPFQFRSGSVPILISIPHNGAVLPAAVAKSMTAEGRSSQDTDWFLDRLYELPGWSKCSTLVASFSRYLIDLNRSRDDQSLYPGQTTTGLIPTQRFDGAPVYLGPTPGKDDIQDRIEQVWVPYHDKIRAELDRLCDEHSVAVLIEAHSIKSQVPRLFEGVLPDFNIGTNRNQSCESSLTDAVSAVLSQQSKYSHVINERFIGGYITRHFGSPKHRIHALQIELSQATYMDETALTWDSAKATEVQKVIQNIGEAVLQWTHQH